MRHVHLCFVIAALSACSSNQNGDDSPPDPIDAPAAACTNIAGNWGITGGCGADTCVITQAGCSTELDCGGGAASYTGSITGNQFMYSGTAGGGVPASCSGTVNGNLINGSCTVANVPCTFNGQRL